MTTKSDMDRVGLFKELGYHTVGDPYKPQTAIQFNEASSKGKQLVIGGTKTKSALTAGYFTDFARAFEKEGYSDPIKMRRLQRLDAGKHNLGKQWIPSSNPKKPSGVGSYHGTFAGTIEHFAPQSKPKPSYKVPGKNVMTAPAKTGTGYGYLNVTIGKYPDYKGESYGQARTLMAKENQAHRTAIASKGKFKLNMHPIDYFDYNPYKSDKSLTASRSEDKSHKDTKPFKPSNPERNLGGTFDPFPKYSPEPYGKKVLERPVNVVNNTGKSFLPNSGTKGTPSYSVMNQNIMKAMNIQNHRSMQAVMNY